LIHFYKRNCMEKCLVETMLKLSEKK